MNPLWRSKEFWEYYLETITSRKQEIAFEVFCTRLVKEKICPNIIRQTGPTGGGDSGADAYSYPVAPKIFCGQFHFGHLHNRPTAFAFSSKKDWQPKFRSDMAKMKHAVPGVACAFFITNQFVPDKKRHQLTTIAGKEHRCEVHVLDRTWLMDQLEDAKIRRLAITVFGLNEPEALTKSERRRQSYAAYDKGLDYQTAKDRRRAEKCYKKAIRLWDQYPEVFYNLALLYRDARNLEAATIHYRLALLRDPHYADAHHNLGFICEIKGRLFEATRHYQDALEIDPHRLNSRRNLAIVKAKCGDFNGAISDLLAILRLHPKDAETWYNLGVAYAKANKSGKAIEAHRKAVTLNRGHFKAHNNLGLLLMHARKHGPAAVYLKRAVSLNPRDSFAWYNLGLTLERSGKLPDAEEAYRRALRLDPRDVDTRNRLALIAAKM